MDNLVLKQQLDEKQLAILSSELDKRKKSKGAAYLLWFFLGGLGAHRIYLGDTAIGLSMLFGLLFSVILSKYLPFLGIIWLLIVIFDVFSISQRYRLLLERTELEIIKTLGV